VEVADAEAEDPIVVLLASLREHRAPPLSWTVEFASDGRIDRAWVLTKDPEAMQEILGEAWKGSAWFPKGQKILTSPVVQAGIAMGISVLLDVLVAKRSIDSNAAPPSMMPYPVTSAIMPHAAHWVKAERARVAGRIRLLYPKPPMLRELFERYKVGTCAEK
jgi:hypothetical protein